MAQRSILITGCSSGIGYDAAHGLAKRGWRVFATARKPEDVARLADEGLEALRLDVTIPEQMDEVLELIRDRTGGTLDAVFLNAAHGLPGAVEDLPTDGLRACFETNFFAVHELVRKVIPIMRAQGHGHIVINGSILGFVVYPWRAAYNTTKFALEGYADTLRIEMADTPVRVVLVEPGPITSNIRRNSVQHFERWIDWEASPRAEQYRSSLLKRLYEDRGPDPFELPPSAVTRKLARALDRRDPPPRIFVTTPTYAMNLARRLLPTRALDWLIRRG